MRGWLNDSSGMFYLNGKWHDYYMNTRFGNYMAGPNNNWSHAVSTDLLHWEEEPMLHTIIREKQCYWMGSAAVDLENATGLGTPSVEVTTNGGERYIVKGRDFKKLGEKSPLEISVEGGEVTFRRLESYPLKSIQPPLPR